MPTRRTGISGPYTHGKRWRVVCQTAGKRETLSFATSEEAAAFVDEWRTGIEGETVSAALDRWIAHKADAGRTPITLATLRNSVQRMLEHLPPKLHEVDERATQRAYRALVATGCAVATHRNTLAQCRAMWRWLAGKATDTPWDKVAGVGRKARGKTKLTIDESRRFIAAALELGERSPGAIAAAVCLTLALRSGEVVALRGRDIDNGGRMLWVQDGKTVNAARAIEVPDLIRPALMRLARAAGNEGALFAIQRETVGYWVARVCARAGVRRVCPHGLRGTHATIAAAAGVTAHVVAATLGHGKIQVTRDHYIAPGAEVSGSAARLGTILVTTGHDGGSDDASTRN